MGALRSQGRLPLKKGRANKAVVVGDDYPALLRARGDAESAGVRRISVSISGRKSQAAGGGPTIALRPSALANRTHSGSKMFAM
jgi:hypothetical protein